VEYVARVEPFVRKNHDPPSMPSALPVTRRLIDASWRAAYRVLYPLALLWWRLRRPRHEGALIAIHVGTTLLLVRSSYRRAWSFPGGGLHHGEAPEGAARRELIEEIGLEASAPLMKVGEVSGLWEGRRDRVHLFTLRLDALPSLRFDNREIIGARLVPLHQVPALRLTEPVRAYVEGRISGGIRDDPSGRSLGRD